jgi:glycosyltransferase involved in cell wall biosynthesis
MYPRFSETFILNEILAHEAAGLDLEIFSLRLPIDGCFHDTLARVRAPVTYLPDTYLKASEFWAALGQASQELPHLWTTLEQVQGEDVGDVYQAVLLARAVLARGVTHLHAHFGSVATTVARLAAHLTGLPYSFTTHAKDIFHESVQSDDLHRKLNDAAAVVTISEYNLAHLCQVYGPAAGRVCRIYNGLDLDRFAYEAPYHRPPRIISVGRLIEKKGFEDLIDAGALLAQQGRQFQAEIIGAGPLEADLRARINRLDLEGWVKLLGPCPQAEVIHHIRGAAVFAAPCVVGQDGNRDGLPTVLLEAMALGTPCVSTDVTGIPEALRHGLTGLCVPQHNPAALAAALAQLLDDSVLRVRLATEARRLIETEFDVRRNTAQLRQLFLATQRSGAKTGAQRTYPQITSAFVRGKYAAIFGPLPNTNEDMEE